MERPDCGSQSGGARGWAETNKCRPSHLHKQAVSLPRRHSSGRSVPPRWDAGATSESDLMPDMTDMSSRSRSGSALRRKAALLDRKMVRRRPLPRLAQGQLRQLTPHRTAVRSCAARSACGGALRSPQLGRLRRDSRAADLRGRCTTSPRTGAAQLRATATETTARGGGPLSSACSATTKRCAASGCLSLCHCRRELRSSAPRRC